MTRLESPAAVVPTAAPTGSAAMLRSGRGSELLYFAFRNQKVLGGLTVILGFLLLGLVAPLLTDHHPLEYVGPPAAAPSAEYWFGTTYFGQDVFLQFANGIRSSFLVAGLAAGLAAVIGMAVGFVAGYRGGLVDELLMIATNIVLVLPVFVVLIVITAYLEVNNLLVQALIIGLFSWPWVARAVRAQTFSLRSREYVDLARLTGRRPFTIVCTEIASNMSSYLLMSFILLFGGAVLFAAALDFLGLGPQGNVSLGLMLQQATAWNALHLGMWWWFVPPGAAITVMVGAAYLTNVGLDEVFNPRLRDT